MDLVAFFRNTLVPYVRAHLGRSERGAALVEYALLVALIAVVCIAAITLVGERAEDKFSNIAGNLQ